jgi:hypothetical protein
MVNPTAQRGANQVHILCGGSPVDTGRHTSTTEARGLNQ